MLTSGRLSRSGRRAPEPYNQYNLIEMLINGKPMHGRPVEYDSEPTTPDCKNIFGVYVKPTKLATTCPDCGAGLFVAVKLPDPPFPKITHTCEHCNPNPVVEPLDPFVNPLDTGRIAGHELDPLLHDGSRIIDDNLTVAERMNLPSKIISVPYTSMPGVPITLDPNAQDLETLPGVDGLEACTAQEEAQEIDLNDLLGSVMPEQQEFKETQGRAVEKADGILPEDDSDLVE